VVRGGRSKAELLGCVFVLSKILSIKYLMVEPIFEFVIIAIFIIIVIIEMFLSGRWHPPYFRKGIRIYSKTYICGSMAQVPVEEVALCEAFKRKV
jgi:hypothetical protein